MKLRTLPLTYNISDDMGCGCVKVCLTVYSRNLLLILRKFIPKTNQKNAEEGESFQTIKVILSLRSSNFIHFLMSVQKPNGEIRGVTERVGVH